MKEAILIDIGSSTVKVYKKTGKTISLIKASSIPFKNGFSPKKGISAITKKELIDLIQKIKEENKNVPIKIYATAVFRKFEKTPLEKFKKDFFEKTKINFKVISQKLENEYLQTALAGKYKGKEKILLINIGGGSTELVVMKNKKILETKNVSFGVGDVLNKFPEINNNKKSGVPLTEVKKFVNSNFPELKNTTRIGFYSGGELTYMRVAKYKLGKNFLFKDDSHPLLITLKDFAKRNKDIFGKVTFKELEKMMPKNPRWMVGARACSALAEAICERYGVLTIIPSDSNLINGVVRRDF